jgi:capsular exopolysaccharide synthesis family protein
MRKVFAHSSDSLDSLRIVGDNTPFAISEAFRSLYAKIKYLPKKENCHKIVITSAESGEGKTFISINLALTLASNNDNKKVLLIDLDMRKPRVSRLIGELCDGNSDVGASEYLALISETPNILKTKTPNLDILFSGQKSVNPIGLLNSLRLKDLIDSASGTYDYIVFDTPPVNVVSDALLLSDKVDGYIIVSRADYSNVNSLSAAIDGINKVGGTIYGSVLCNVNPKSMYGSKNKEYRNTYYNV